MKKNTLSCEALEKALEETLNKREELRLNLIGYSVISNATKAEGVIKEVTKKYLFINFECWVSIPVPIKNLESLITVDDSIMKTAKEYFDTFTIERKLKLRIIKLKKALCKNTASLSA